MTDAELSKALEVEAERDQLRIEVGRLREEIAALRQQDWNALMAMARRRLEAEAPAGEKP